MRAIPQCCILSVMYTRATAPNRSRWCAEQAALKGDPKSWEKPMATNLLRGGGGENFLFVQKTLVEHGAPPSSGPKDNPTF